jgi:hypothetical protein
MGVPMNRRKNTRRTLVSANIKRPPSEDSLKLPQIRASSSIIINRKSPMPINEENSNTDRETAGLFESNLNLLKPSGQVRQDRRRNSTKMDLYASKRYISMAIDADEDGNFGETMDKLGPSYNKRLMRLPSIHQSGKVPAYKVVVDENDEFDEAAWDARSRSLSRTYHGEGGDTEG